MAQTVPGAGHLGEQGGSRGGRAFLSSASSLLPRQQCNSTEPSLSLPMTKIIIKMVPLRPRLSPFTEGGSQTPAELGHRKWTSNTRLSI